MASRQSASMRLGSIDITPILGRRRLLYAMVGMAFASAAGYGAPVLAADANSAVAKLNANQIVEKFIAARGGLSAWHGVQTMSCKGKMDAGRGDSAARSAAYAHSNMSPKKKAEVIVDSKTGEKSAEDFAQVRLPFLLEMKRPGSSRLELEFNGKTSVQAYDGKAGWKLRPFLNRDDWEPFTPDELKASAGKWELDGPLLDYSARGTKVDLEGVEAVEGHDAYRLKLTLKSGDVQHVWIDAKTFLDVKVEGTPHRMDGKMRKVYIAQHDFRNVQGLMVPFELVTTVEGYPDQHKMSIDQILLNPVLGDELFTKPKAGKV